MSAAPAALPPAGIYEPRRIVELRFDTHNPRSPDSHFQTDGEITRFLLDEYEVDEIVRSILSIGWMDFEPMIVRMEDNVVLEGNRRLAALKLITEEKLRKEVNYKLPAIQAADPGLSEISVRLVPDRESARNFIAFKHITGPFKWDAEAKAHFAADWLAKPGVTLKQVSQALGDTHATIRRLVDGWNVLKQAEAQGFSQSDRTKKNAPLDFSHLYTAIARPAVRDFLSLSDERSEALSENPVPKERSDNLQELMGWLYGQESRGRTSVIRSQNPNLGELVKVMAHPAALDEIRRSGDLAQAFSVAEGPKHLFASSLKDVATRAEKSLGLVKHYDGDADLLNVVKNLAITVRELRDRMIEKQRDDVDL